MYDLLKRKYISVYDELFFCFDFKPTMRMNCRGNLRINMNRFYILRIVYQFESSGNNL